MTSRHLWPCLGAGLLSAMSAVASPALADGPLSRAIDLFERLEKTQFAVIGDTPYRDTDIPMLDEVLREINASGMEFTVHNGDIKSGSSLCSDDLFQVRFNQLQQLRRPLVYTPGDNEWTDCHRPAAGGYQPLERLAKIRSLFFANPNFTTGKLPMRVRSQSSDPAYATFVENALFVKNDIVFATVHVVGSNNNRATWSGIGETAAAPRQDRLAEVAARTAAALAWIDKAFDEAEARGAAGVFLAMQANPAFESAQGSPERLGFDEIVQRISDRTVAFARPVLVAHGDSHYFRYDKPLIAPTLSVGPRRLEDFARLENFGDTDVHWVEVVADPKTPEVFRIVAHIVQSNRFER
ncbi:MAG: hypothetical protein QM778_14800 [Myxococcales bacterium]